MINNWSELLEYSNLAFYKKYLNVCFLYIYKIVLTVFITWLCKKYEYLFMFNDVL